MSTYHSKRIDNPRYVHLASSIHLCLRKSYPDFIPHSVIDFGCSVGSLLKHLKINQKVGVDHSGIAGELWCCDDGKFIQANLEGYFTYDRKFDLLTCFEVAEHLMHYSELFNTFSRLRNRNSILMFSAAHPKQKGKGHVSCRWHRNWMRDLEERGWWFDPIATNWLCHSMGVENKTNNKKGMVIPSFYLNSMVFTSIPRREIE